MFTRPNDIIYKDDFLRDVRTLPKNVQGKLGLLIEILRDDSFDPRLHTKPLGPPLHGLFSFRIIRGYRVGFDFISPHTIRLIIADRRDKIYKRLQRK